MNPLKFVAEEGGWFQLFDMPSDDSSDSEVSEVDLLEKISNDDSSFYEMDSDYDLYSEHFKKDSIK